jgi:hypothetical protein
MLQAEEIATLRAEMAQMGRDHAAASTAAGGAGGRGRKSRERSRDPPPPPPPPSGGAPDLRIVPVAANAEQEAALVAA